MAIAAAPKNCWGLLPDILKRPLTENKQQIFPALF
jgi:hypothetical protein